MSSWPRRRGWAPPTSWSNGSPRTAGCRSRISPRAGSPRRPMRPCAWSSEPRRSLSAPESSNPMTPRLGRRAIVEAVTHWQDPVEARRDLSWSAGRHVGSRGGQADPRGNAVAPRVVMRCGVLALQGDWAAHAEVLRILGVETTLVRTAAELATRRCPGSSGGRVHRHASSDGAGKPRREDLDSGARTDFPLLATCAGVILLATSTTPGAAEHGSAGYRGRTKRLWSPGPLDGSQRSSSPLSSASRGRSEGVFIRAPRITRTGPGMPCSRSMWRRSCTHPSRRHHRRHLPSRTHRRLSSPPSAGGRGGRPWPMRRCFERRSMESITW